MSEETPTAAEPAAGAAAAADDADAQRKAEQEAIQAVRSLPPRLRARLCRSLSLRTFLPALEKLDRAVFFRYFKGLRPVKIDAALVEKMVQREIGERGNGMVAQLVTYNWDEVEHLLYRDLQDEVKKINEDVEAIAAIGDDEGDAIVDALQATYDPRDIYIAFVINGVRVAPAFYPRRFPTLGALTEAI